MAIPKFNDMMIPILDYLSEVEGANYKDLMSFIQKKFQLSEEEMRETLSTGQLTIYNRIGWSIMYLKKADLVARNKGLFKITPLGREEAIKLKNENINLLTVKIMRDRYPLFEQWKIQTSRKKLKTEEELEETDNNKHTPQEDIESSYQDIKESLKEEIIGQIFEQNPFFFEKLVVDLLINLGYGGSRKEAGKAFQTSKDEGIDGTIVEDKLGLDLIHVQAKRWKNSVGRPEIQKFAGALQGKRVKKGIFITTSYFSKEAIDFAKGLESKIILIDGDELTEHMIESDTGVVTEATYRIKKVDESYFNEV